MRQYSTGEMSIFRELTEGLPRQAPGSAAATLRALGLVRGLPTASANPRRRMRSRRADGRAGPRQQRLDRRGRYPPAIPRRTDRTRRRRGSSAAHNDDQHLDVRHGLRRPVIRSDLVRGRHLYTRIRRRSDRMAAVPEARRMDRGIRAHMAGAESAGRSRRILGAELSRHGLDRAQHPARGGSRIREHGRLRAPDTGLVEQLLRPLRAPGRGTPGKVRRRSRGARDPRPVHPRERSLPHLPRQLTATSST